MSTGDLPPNHYWYRGVLLNVLHPKDHVDRFLDQFQFQSDDIVLATYPRSGTLLTQEIIWHIKNRHIIQPGENHGEMSHRFPYIEFLPPGGIDFIDLLETRGAANEQRFIKTHMPPHAILDNIKDCRRVVIVYRDAKDVAASFFNFFKNFTHFENWPPNWESFVEHFTTDRVWYGSVWKWNMEWLKLGDLENIHIIKYEDIARDKTAMIRKLAEFLDEGDISEEEIEIIIHNTSFNNMAANQDVNRKMENNTKIMRKGVVGDFRNYFTKEQEELFDSFTKKLIEPYEQN